MREVDASTADFDMGLTGKLMSGEDATGLHPQ